MIVAVTFVVTQEALEFIASKNMKTPNIVVYRDASGTIYGYTTREPTFISRVKVTDREPNELFVVADNTCGIPIWVEKGLFLRLSNTVVIALKKELRKKLELQTGGHWP